MHTLDNANTIWHNIYIELENTMLRSINIIVCIIMGMMFLVISVDSLIECMVNRDNLSGLIGISSFVVTMMFIILGTTSWDNS
jgi:ammonia channel protein AmtB